MEDFDEMQLIHLKMHSQEWKLAAKRGSKKRESVAHVKSLMAKFEEL